MWRLWRLGWSLRRNLCCGPMILGTSIWNHHIGKFDMEPQYWVIFQEQLGVPWPGFTKGRKRLLNTRHLHPVSFASAKKVCPCNRGRRQSQKKGCEFAKGLLTGRNSRNSLGQQDKRHVSDAMVAYARAYEQLLKQCLVSSNPLPLPSGCEILLGAYLL